MKRLILLLLVGLRLAFATQGQTYFNERHELQPAGSCGALGLLARPDGYVTVGVANTGLNQEQPLQLAFFDTAGQLLQERLYQHAAGPILYPFSKGPFLELPDGGFAVGGSVVPTNRVGLGQLWRFNAAGDTLWTRTYRPANPLHLVFYQHCYVPADSGFALVGVEKTSATQWDMVLLRTDKNGHERWRSRFRSMPYNHGFNVCPTPDGGFLISGRTAIFPTFGPFVAAWFVVKTDANGQEQWRYILDGPFMDVAGPGVVLPDGSYLIGGLYSTYSDELQDISLPMLVRLNAQGQELWRRTYGPTSYNAGPAALRLLPDGTALFAGQMNQALPMNVVGTMAAFVVKVCAATGDSIWYRTYRNLPHPSDNYLRDLTPTSDGGFAATGFLHPRFPATGAASVWLFKADEHGYLQPGGAPPTTVACPPLGVEDEEDIGKGLDIYPNPSADGRFTLRQVRLGATSLTVSDALGRVVWRGKSNGAETAVDIQHHSAGLYLLRVQWPDGRSVMRKLVRE